MIRKELLDILACPSCKTKVELREDMLVCERCGRRYPIDNDIPVMLIEEGDKHRLPGSDQAQTKE